MKLEKGRGKDSMKHELRFLEKLQRSWKHLLMAVAIVILSTPFFAFAAEEGLEFSSLQKNYVQLEQAFGKMPQTMELTVNLKEGTGKRQVLFGNYTSDSANAFSIEVTSAGQLRYFELAVVNGKAQRTDIKTEESVCDGNWKHFAIVRDEEKGELTIYQNGEVILKTEVNLQEQMELTNSHYIGTDSRKSYFLDGGIEKICLWEDVRTQEEILSDENLTGQEEGLMHYWLLNDTIFDSNPPVLKDVKENGIDGTVHGFEIPVTPPFNGEGVNFSENDISVEMENNLVKAPLTFEAWLNIPEASADGRGGVICGNYYNSYYGNIPLVNFEIHENGSPRIYWNIDGKEYDCIISGVNVARGKWLHLAMAYDLKTKKMNCYVNGVLEDSVQVTNGGKSLRPVSLTQPLKIGRDARPDKNLRGSIGEVRIWSTTRTAEEISGHFEKKLTGEEKGLLGCWVLEENQDNVYEDISVNKNTAKEYWLEQEMEEGDYSFVVIPDTQELAASYPEKLKTMTQWLKDNQEKYNIQLALQVGDLVDTNGNAGQWTAISESMSVLDGVIPYVFAPGNHDTPSNRDTTMFNTYFPYDKYAGQETFGGAFEEGKMDNTYSFFTVQGIEFMTVCLETAPRAEVLEWANEVVENNPDKKVIVSTHAYLFYDGRRTTSESPDQPNYMGNACTGEEMWNEFVRQHENIILVVSGHVGYPDLIVTEDVGIHGNTVQQVLCDAQFMDKSSEGGGLGMLMMMTFKKDSNEVEVNWYSTDRDRLFRDRNQFTMTLEIYQEQISEPDKTVEEALKEAEKAKEEAEKAREEAEKAKQEAEAAQKKAAEDQNNVNKLTEEAKAAIEKANKLQAEAEEAKKAAEQAKEKYENSLQVYQTASVKKVSLKAVRSQKKKELKVTWKKVAGVSGYQVQYSANAKFKNAKTKKLKAAKTSLKLKKLKSKKTYYVRVRAYKKTKSGVVYGSYSKVKKGKVK